MYVHTRPTLYIYSNLVCKGDFRRFVYKYIVCTNISSYDLNFCICIGVTKAPTIHDMSNRLLTAKFLLEPEFSQLSKKINKSTSFFL